MSTQEKLSHVLKIRNSRKTRMEKLEVNKTVQTMNEMDKLTATMSKEDIEELMKRL